MCSLCRFPVAKKQFLANFDFLELLYQPPFTDEGQMWCAIADPRYTLRCQSQISSRSVYSVALCWRKSPIFALFWISAFRLSPTGNSLTNLNMSEQLRTFPYPTVLKSFLYSNAFVAKSGAECLTFKSVSVFGSYTLVVAPMGVPSSMPIWPMPNFTPIGATCRPCRAKNLKIGL